MDKEQEMRKFDSGATRNIDNNKLDFEGFFSPIVLHRYAEYLQKHRKQKDGNIRDSDNWQKGIPKDAYMKSELRHTMDLWLVHRGFNAVNPDDGTDCDIEELLCAITFNSMGYLFELLKEKCKKRD